MLVIRWKTPEVRKVRYLMNAAKTSLAALLCADKAAMEVASVGLRVSASHDPGEIACCYLQICYLWTCDMRICEGFAAGDEATSKSYKCLHLTPVDGSSFVFFSFRAIAVFSRPPAPVFLS